MTYQLKVKRVYEPEQADDGYRILADRLWPRGESKIKADLDEWPKEAAPSKELREAFHHGQMDYPVFRKNYLKELQDNPKAIELRNEIARKLLNQNVTLLYGSKNQKENNAEVLREWIEENRKAEPDSESPEDSDKRQ